MRLASYLDHGHESLGLVASERLLLASDTGPEFPTTLGDLLEATNGDWTAIRRSALKAGNLALYQQEINLAQQLVQQASQLAAQSGASPSPSPTPSPSP